MICAVGRCLQPVAVRDDDLLSGEIDNPPVLQIVRRNGDARPPYSSISDGGA